MPEWVGEYERIQSYSSPSVVSTKKHFMSLFVLGFLYDYGRLKFHLYH